MEGCSGGSSNGEDEDDELAVLALRRRRRLRRGVAVLAAAFALLVAGGVERRRAALRAHASCQAALGAPWPPPRGFAGGVTLAALGDWGGTGRPPHSTAPQRAVGASLRAFLDASDAHGVLALGDNFLPNGLQGTEAQRELRWRETWREVYAPSPARPWRAVAGNRGRRRSAARRSARRGLGVPGALLQLRAQDGARG